MADERNVARIIGNDVELGVEGKNLFFMLRGMVSFCPDMVGNSLGDEVHCLGYKDDVSALYHLPDGSNLPWQEEVGIELLHACLLFVRREAFERPYRSAANEVDSEEFIEERVELIPAYMQEVVGRVGVKQGPTDVH